VLSNHDVSINREITKWEHNPEHRGGVRYRDNSTTRKFANVGKERKIDLGVARSRDPGRQRPGGGDRTGQGASNRLGLGINQFGILFQKDLGEETANLAAAITEYDPDQSWEPVTDLPPSTIRRGGRMPDHSARPTGFGRKNPWTSALAALCCAWPALVLAEIFRYQDDAGDWHFTDNPPKRYESSVVPGIATSKPPASGSVPTRDLSSRLKTAFDPITPIAYSTLAVVSIRTDSSEGSGFFCSEDGHILTNAHLVRPAPAESTNARETAAKGQEEKLRTLEARLTEARGQLKLMKQDLAGYEELIEEARNERTRSLARTAQQRLRQRYGQKQSRTSTMDRKLRSIRTELRNTRRNLATERSSRLGKTRFDIMLRDGTELSATLVKISDSQDLALLKLEGYRTPFLSLDSSARLSQGERVFAIGNPLGMQSAVSSGVVTQIAPDHLYTDAQILPGSSGGPLIRESGAVVGINVARRVAAGTSRIAAGFGKAIPAALAAREFPQAQGTIATDNFRVVLPQTRDAYWGATLGSDSSRGIGAYTTGTPEAGKDGRFGSEPVRMIVPGQDANHRMKKPVEEPTARSLDFPPEGAGLPPEISRHQE